ncbi:MAG TPA: hypothetical protein VL088_03390, partial [Pedobacter sp.]|nr:hypothetical protein [Pedobacter sp.]
MMKHVLDNPIYNALHTAHKSYAKGNDEVNYYIEDVAPFAGLKDNSHANLDELFEMSAPESTFVVFTPTAYEIPHRWKLITQIDMFQMVYNHMHAPEE